MSFLAIKNQVSHQLYNLRILFVAIVSATVLYSCSESSGNEPSYQPQMQSLPVVAINALPATTYQEFTASIEGTKDIEIRPQVNGYIEKIFVDEGAHVKKGQNLFQINDRPYLEAYNNAKATLTAAKANLSTAEINVSKLKPLVESNIISDVQYKTAQSAYDAAKANVAQAEAMVENAHINLGYALIKAPADGYIGRIVFKTGSLVGTSTAEPLTVLSDINRVYAYFSFSENDFIRFKDQFPGKSVEEKIKQLPEVELMLSDNSIYPKKGKVEMVAGQFDNTTGSISLRAIFPNADGLIRSGNTGKIRIPRSSTKDLIVPQEATFELQDKVFVFTLADSNKVSSTPIHVSGTSGNYYLVDKGIAEGQKIVYSGLDRLQDGAIIQPQPITMDSLLKVNPL
ncbi:MAG: efflux RND transporter periplasmic adaptor subunit [Chitinophagaceae bacterium]|nr:efflux RND transporter periplasmic adaptor subunit [Chitinophagaceae bacterium]